MEEEETHLIPTDISSQIPHLGLFFLVFSIRFFLLEKTKIHQRENKCRYIFNAYI